MILLDSQITTETEEDFQKMLVPLLIRDTLHLEEIKEEADPREKYMTSDYVVPPKVPQMQMGPAIGPVR